MSEHHLDKRAADLIAAGAGNPDDLLTTKDVAAWFGASVITLEIWRTKGEGPPFIKLTPRMVRYQRGGVLNWLAEREYASTAEYRAWGSADLNRHKDEWRSEAEFYKAMWAAGAPFPDIMHRLPDGRRLIIELKVPALARATS